MSFKTLTSKIRFIFYSHLYLPFLVLSFLCVYLCCGIISFRPEEISLTFLSMQVYCWWILLVLVYFTRFILLSLFLLSIFILTKMKEQKQYIKDNINNILRKLEVSTGVMELHVYVVFCSSKYPVLLISNKHSDYFWERFLFSLP